MKRGAEGTSPSTNGGNGGDRDAHGRFTRGNPGGATYSSKVAKDYEAPMKPAEITAKTWQGMNPKQKAFFTSFIQDGNALKAYQDAGYVENRDGVPQAWLQRRAYSVLRGKAVRLAILEHEEQRARLDEAKRDYALDWIVSEHERLMQVAEEKGDLAVATRNLELIGRTRGVYSDSVVVDVAQRREYSEAEKIEAARLSRLLLMEDAEADKPEAPDAPEAPVEAEIGQAGA